VFNSASSRLTQRRVAAVVIALVLVAAACGGSSNKNNATSNSGSGGSGTASDTTKPVAGGKVIFGVGAETAGGFCLPEARLAIEGIQVTRSVYDTITVPDENGTYKPFLAKSVTHDATYKEWTIVVRDGVVFHDGSKLDATVLKNNMDAYRGQYTAADGSKPRKPDLLSLVLTNITDTTVVDPATLKITMKIPWVAFDGYLFGSGRLGIMGQAQLDDTASCDKKLIGTGPFKVKGGTIASTQDIDLVKNPNYWQKDASGTQLPYLDELEYRAIADEAQRMNALKSGEITANLTNNGATIAELRDLKSQGKVESTETDKFAEVNYWLLNSSSAPFNNQAAREAVALAYDRDTYNQVQNAGVLTPADGPFPSGNLGFVENTGFPHFNLDQARAKVAQYKQETGQDLSFTLTTTNEPSTVAGAQLYQQMLKAAGIPVQLAQTDQTALINQAIAGQVQMFGWRNHQGGDPDTQYYWWHSTFKNTTNFGKIQDAEVDRLLDDGRSNTDPAARKKDYEDLNKLLGSKVYNVWEFYSKWTIGTAPNVHGVFGPDLPDGGGKPWPTFVLGDSVAGLFVTK
jgi:peptide/nickel transport system substrate-binding protein